MSDLQEIALKVTKLVSDTSAFAAQLRSYAKAASLMNERLLSLMASTTQSSYQTISAQMQTAQKKILDAANMMDASSNTAKSWLAGHTSGAAAFGSGGAAAIGGFAANDAASLSEDEAFRKLSEYMNEHHYSQEDYGVYSQDPYWRILHRAAFPNDELPPLNRQTAFLLLSQYMSAHHYGRGDYGTYSSDPVWQELHRFAFPDKRVPLARPDAGTASPHYNTIVSSLQSAHVAHRPLEPSMVYRSGDEIVQRLGGGDRTDGSCSSLAFAYIGNKAGYEALDFRGGESCDFFSSNRSISTIAHLPGVISTIVTGSDDIACTRTLMNSMQEGKEYYLATGLHAAIVRKEGWHYEYLELQSAWNNGWKRLDTQELLNRFGCETAQTQQYPNFLIDTDSLLTNHEFLDIIGYLNTAETEQRKGVDGHVK